MGSGDRLKELEEKIRQLEVLDKKYKFREKST